MLRDRCMSSWEALWYVLGVLLYPIAYSSLGLFLMNVGVKPWLAYIVAIFGLPFVWLPVNHLLMRRAWRLSQLGKPAEDAEPILLEPKKRPLIR